MFQFFKIWFASMTVLASNCDMAGNLDQLHLLWAKLLLPPLHFVHSHEYSSVQDKLACWHLLIKEQLDLNVHLISGLHTFASSGIIATLALRSALFFSTPGCWWRNFRLCLCTCCPNSQPSWISNNKALWKAILPSFGKHGEKKLTVTNGFRFMSQRKIDIFVVKFSCPIKRKKTLWLGYFLGTYLCSWYPKESDSRSLAL